MKTVYTIALFLGVAAADDCFVSYTHQHNGGIDGTGDKLRGQIERGPCPMNVDDPNSDDCEVLADFIPVLGQNNAIDAGLSNLVASTVSDPNAEDGFMDFEDQHHDFNDDDGACEKSKSSGLGAALSMTVCRFAC